MIKILFLIPIFFLAACDTQFPICREGYYVSVLDRRDKWLGEDYEQALEMANGNQMYIGSGPSDCYYPTN